MGKVGLVLEGGAMRGIYAAGVMDYYLDAGIRFDYVVAVSAGACNAASYISKQKCRSLLVNCAYCDDDRYAGVKTFLKTGSYCGMDFMFNDIQNKLIPFDMEAFKNSPQKLTVVTIDADTAQSVYKVMENAEEDMEYIKASSSLPILTPPVVLEGKELYDGGVTKAIPFAKSIEDGNDKHVIILTHNRGYVRPESKIHSIYKLAFAKKKPKLYKALCDRARGYNEQMKKVMELEKEGKAFVYMPTKPVTIGRFTKDRDKLLELYFNGYEDARNSADQLKDFCKDMDNVVFEGK